MDFFRRLFSSDFVPHGHCYLWRPDLVWLNVISDSLIAAAYYSIPLIMIYLLHKRSSFRLRGLMAMFAGFILACGTTHIMSVWNIWHSTYRLEGLVKAITAALSIATAIVTMKVAPGVLRMPSAEELERTQENLLQETRARADAEARLRHSAEAARLSGEAKVTSYLEAASQGIIAVTAEGRIALVNRRTEEIFGYKREELLGQKLEMLLPERYRAAHAMHRHEYFSEPRMRAMGADMELAGKRKDGSEFPVEIGLSYTESEGEVIALGLVSDITERKRSESELARATADVHASEATLRSYLESAPQAILATSADGRILMVNRRTEQMFGYERSELLGQQLEMLVPERFRAAHPRMRADYFDQPKVRAMESRRELTALSKQGVEFPVDIGLSYVPTENGILALSLVSDVTDRKLAADELARVNGELRRSNAELEQFAYVASHDLQEPLRIIISYLNLLQRRYGDRLDDDATEFIRYAVDGSNRMKDLIRDVLSFSRVGTRAVQAREVSSSEILKTALENLTATIAEREAEVTADPLPTVVVDPGLLVQVFQNLIGNAIKFTRQSIPRVHVSAERRNGEWVFSIRDHGIGIEAAHQDRIFRIFERLHPAEEYPGTGVGLAVCKKIVERHGGRIWVDSQVGSGSVFNFTLPAEARNISQISTASNSTV